MREDDMVDDDELVVDCEMMVDDPSSVWTPLFFTFPK